MAYREPPPPSRAVRVERGLAAATMALLCVITFANVLARHFTSVSFAWTEEISVFLLVFMTLVGAATAFAGDNHIRITILAEALPPRGRAVLDRVAAAASVAMFALLTGLGARFAWDDFRYQVTTPALDLPQWLYSATLPLLSLVILARLLRIEWEGAR